MAARECVDCGIPLGTWPDDLCPGCQARVRIQTDRLLEDIGHMLGLEAEFVRWCAEHGQPNPHD